MYEVLISDGYCTHKYHFGTDNHGDYSIEDVANCIANNMNMEKTHIGLVKIGQKVHSLLGNNPKTTRPFKYNIGQLVYSLIDNRVHSALILSRRCVENKSDIDEQINTYECLGKSGITYSTIHGIHKESEIFASKEDLLNSL